MNKFLRYFVSCLLLTTGSSKAADYDVSALAQALDDFIPHVLSQHHTPGLVISLANRDGVFFNRGYGFANVEARVPMPADAVIKGGSIGKLYTATAILQLVDRGIVELEIYNFAGVRDTPDPKTIERMSHSGEELLIADSGPVFDPEGFRAGFEAGLAIPQTYQALQHFWASEELAVSQAELSIIFEQLGQSNRIGD